MNHDKTYLGGFDFLTVLVIVTWGLQDPAVQCVIVTLRTTTVPLPYVGGANNNANNKKRMRLLIGRLAATPR